MVLPLGLLKAATNTAVLVELKNGETLSGILASCDGFMNVHLRSVIVTSADGDKFWKLDESFVRGNTVKYVRLSPQTLETAQIHAESKKRVPSSRGRGRGRCRGRGS